MNREEWTGDRARAIAPWTEEPVPTHDEREWAAWVEPGWASWNDMSPEVAWCEFVAQLACLMRPTLILETGVGQGFTTRRLTGHPMVCYEADDDFRAALRSLDAFRGQRSLSDLPTPDSFAGAQLSILDSNEPWREHELAMWQYTAPSGAVALVHDTGNGHPEDSPHAKVRRDVEALGLPGVFLRNPRGSWLGFKP